MLKRFLLIGIVLVAPAAPGGLVYAQSTCPVSCTRFVFNPESCSSRVSVDSTYSACNPSECGDGGFQYDLAIGRIRASVFAPNGGWFSAGVQAVDDYRVAGLSDGQPLVFEARLEVDGVNGGNSPWPELPYGSGSFSVEIREGIANAQSASRGNGAWNLSLAIPIAVNAGTVFRIACAVDASAATGYALAVGQLSFSGLPPGASVVSCQGYRYDVPVPAIPVSWGSVKDRYR